MDIAGAVSAHRKGLVCSVLPGSKNRAKGQKGCPGTWEALPASLRIIPDVGTGVRTPGPRSGVLDRWERSTGTPQGIAKRRQRSAARGVQGVAQRHSTVAAGELVSEDPVKGRALPTGGPGGGNQGEHPVAS